MNTPTHRHLFPETLPTTRTLYCFACKAPGVTKSVQHGLTTYLCNLCGTQSERYLVWDPIMIQHFNQDEELVHESVGVVVQNSVGEVLVFKRIKFPFLWTIPAGHLEIKEEPSQAAIRELREETDITVDQVELLFEGEIRNDSCAGGADIHYWHLYRAVVRDVMPTIEAEEGGAWQWCLPNNLPPDLTYPVAYLLSHKDVVRQLQSPACDQVTRDLKS